MKIFAISDLHLSVNNKKPMDIFGPTWDNYIEKIFDDWKNKICDDDVVLLAGDYSWAMKIDEVVADFEMLKGLPGKKVIIRGNHDYWWKSITAVRKILPPNFYAIQNDAVKFENVVICGTRLWNIPDPRKASEEDIKIYNREIIRLGLTLDSARKLCEEGDKLICMLHYPPYSFREEDNEVTKILEEHKVDAVVYGHIHAYCKQNLVLQKNGVTYYLTSCDIVGNTLVPIEV